jgi:hypothetical protein
MYSVDILARRIRSDLRVHWWAGACAVAAIALATLLNDLANAADG